MGLAWVGVVVGDGDRANEKEKAEGASPSTSLASENRPSLSGNDGFGIMTRQRQSHRYSNTAGKDEV